MNNKLSLSELRAMVQPFAKASNLRGLIEVGLTLFLFFSLLVLAGLASTYSVTLAILMGIPAGILYVRVFVLQHDCGHRSLFANPRLNVWVGRLLSLLALTPSKYWNTAHHVHHQNNGRLDTAHCEGAMLFYTVEQYGKLTRWEKFRYRLFYFPPILFLISPTLLFAGYYRCWWLAKNSTDRKSMIATNIALAVIFTSLFVVIEPSTLVLAYVPAMVVGSSIGVWLFYIQHIFENAYFAHEEDYSKRDAIVQGSSFYQLPRFLNWLTGSIGYHSIHHLNPSIPSYRLHACWEKVKHCFDETPRFTLLQSFRLTGLSLWDDVQKKMVRFT